MNGFLVAAMLVCGSAVAYGLPQGYPYGGGSSLATPCRSQEVSPGVFKVNCEGVNRNDLTLSSEHILWLKAAGGHNHQLDVVVPNYRIEELIRAAIKASDGGSTNINILLKKPDTVYDVQAQDGASSQASPPSVSLQYEQIRKPVSIHYPTEQAYNPLSGPIREP